MILRRANEELALFFVESSFIYLKVASGADVNSLCVLTFCVYDIIIK